MEHYWWAVITCMTILTPLNLSAQTQGQTQVRAMAEMAAAEMSLSWLVEDGLALADPAGAVDGTKMIVQEVQSPLPGLQLFRIEYPLAPHAKPMLFGTVGRKHFQLGGTAFPRLGKLLLALQVRPETPQQMLRLARQLATLADPNGGILIGALDAVEEIDLPEAPRGCGQDERLADAAWPRPWGGVGVRVNLLSWDRERLGVGAWEAVRFGFEFGEDGGLVAWNYSRRPCS